MELGLLHDYFGNFSTRDEKYYFRMDGSTWGGFNPCQVRLKQVLEIHVGGFKDPKIPDRLGGARLGGGSQMGGQPGGMEPSGWWKVGQKRAGARWV